MRDPVLIAYGVTTYGSSSKTYWHRIGEAFPHETGAGLTVILHAVPRDGKIILIERDAADDERLAREAQRLEADLTRSEQP